MDRDALGVVHSWLKRSQCPRRAYFIAVENYKALKQSILLLFSTVVRRQFVAQRCCELLLGGPGRWWLSQVAERTSEPVAETMIAAFQQLLRYERYPLNASLG